MLDQRNEIIKTAKVMVSNSGGTKSQMKMDNTLSRCSETGNGETIHS